MNHDANGTKNEAARQKMAQKMAERASLRRRDGDNGAPMAPMALFSPDEREAQESICRKRSETISELKELLKQNIPGMTLSPSQVKTFYISAGRRDTTNAAQERG